MSHVDPDERREYRRLWRLRNLEERRRKEKEYRDLNHERESARKRAWAKANREKMRESDRKSRAKRRAMVQEKRAEGCSDCPEKDVIVIQLHAPNGHTTHRKTIGDGSRFSYADLERELAICVPLCANCHIRRHHAAR